MHCSHCGHSIASGSRFCSACGAPVPQAYVVRPRLLRPRSGRILGGVCAAFARTYGWNVTLLRILLIVLTPFHFGLGFVAYVIAWIVIPEESYLLASGPVATAPPPSSSL